MNGAKGYVHEDKSLTPLILFISVETRTDISLLPFTLFNYSKVTCVFLDVFFSSCHS